MMSEADFLVAASVTSKWSKGSGGPAGDEVQNLVAHSLRADGFDAGEDGTGRGTPIVAVGRGGDVAATLQSAIGGNGNAGNGSEMIVAFDARQSDVIQYGTDAFSQAVAFSCKDHGADAGEIAPTLRAMGHGGSHANAGGQVAVSQGWAVRRLTPIECERLQGFPDNYTAIPYRGKAAADGPRYKALGNSMACNVMRWIGRRIAMVAAL
jgi:DNA (cytosine-5)-methyltransferase 1